MAKWMLGHESLKSAMPTLGVDIDTLAKTVAVLKCRLRLGTDVVDDEGPHHMSLPTLPVTTRARRELRPKAPLIGASRPGKLAVSQRSLKALKSIRDRTHGLRANHSPHMGVRHNRLHRSKLVAPRQACAPVKGGVCNKSGPPVLEGAIVPLTAPVVWKAESLNVKPKPQYVRRALYLAQRCGATPPSCPTDERDKPNMRTIFSPPLTKLTCPWETALLFRDAPGFFRWAEYCQVSFNMLAAMFHIAIGKRCATESSRTKVAGFVSTYVLFAAQRKALFHGEGALFIIIEYLTLLRRRGPTVPGMAKWALRVFDEILNLTLPLERPAVVALTTRDRSEAPRQVKQAPMLTLELIIDLENLATDKQRPLGMRFYASAYLLMVFASLRFSDVKAVFEIWRTGTAVCGRSIDKKLKSRPIITWGTPSQGFVSKGAWADPLFSIWEKTPPVKGGHHSLYRFCDDSWEIDPTRRPPYYVVLKLFKKICEFLGHKDPKWTLHSARNWFPTCANQLGWSEDDRRKLGHWAPGSQMMEKYDRAVCTTELRLRSSIFGMITDSKWTPTAAFEVPLSLVKGEAMASNQTAISEPWSGHQVSENSIQATPTMERIEEVSDGSSTSSITWDNKSDGLSEVEEVNIADLYV